MIIKVCSICGKKFKTFKSLNRKYCSLECCKLNKSIQDYFFTKNILKKKNNIWISWFTGFWEGEGSLVKNYNKFQKSSHFIFGLTQKDNIVFKLQKEFQFGKINDYFKTKCYQWLFGGTGHILAFVHFMQPYIQILKRKEQINKFLKDSYTRKVIKCLKNLSE